MNRTWSKAFNHEGKGLTHQRIFIRLLLLLAVNHFRGGFSVLGHDGRRSCGTPDLTVEQNHQADMALKKWRTKLRKRMATRQQQSSSYNVVIDTYFHVIQRDDFKPIIPDSLLLQQFDILNERFSPTPFQFALRGITRTQRSAWVGNTRDNNDLEYEINLALGVGGPETMNVYFQPGLCEVDIFAYSSVPQWRGVFPANTYSPKDKVVICPDYLPGKTKPYDLGLTLVHEAGHWLGLQHTFRGLSCAASNSDNDFVDDTPQMLEPTYGCPRYKDSCPFLPGTDLVNNYMDYSDDRCMNTFTPGQIERMLAQVSEFRIKTACDGQEASIRFELQFDDQYQETLWGMVFWGSGGETIRFREDLIFDYAHKFVVFDDCIPTGTLFEFFLTDSLGNGLLPPGFAALTINGREISRFGEFKALQRSVFVSAAPLICEYTVVQLEILFDNSPNEVTWELLDASTSKIMVDSESSLAAGADRYNMAESLLHVDRCLPDGLYTINIWDSGGNGIEAPGYWRVSAYDTMIAEGGSFGSMQSQNFTLGKTFAPSASSHRSVSGAPSHSPSTSTAPLRTPSVSPTIQQPVPIVTCFAGTSSVEVKGRGTVLMKDVKIGDLVLTSTAMYERVYSFGHYQQSQEGTFLEISTMNSTLLVSRDHMVFVDAAHCVPASRLRVRDRVVGRDNGEEVIISIRTVKARGVFAPFTPSGRILVDGILASTFVAFEDTHQLHVGGMAFSYQWLAHSVEFPHRVICVYAGACSNERYNELGISTWVATPHEVGNWILQRHFLLRNASFIILIGFLSVFNLCECNLPLLISALFLLNRCAKLVRNKILSKS